MIRFLLGIAEHLGVSKALVGSMLKRECTKS